MGEKIIFYYLKNTESAQLWFVRWPTSGMSAGELLTEEGSHWYHITTFATKDTDVTKVWQLFWSVRWRSMSGKTERGDFGRNFAYFRLIFRWISAFGTPSAIFPPACLQIPPSSAFFCLFSAYFLPKMVPHPCYKLKHGTPSAVIPPACLQVLPIFRLCSAHFLPNHPLIFCQSCLARCLHNWCLNNCQKKRDKDYPSDLHSYNHWLNLGLCTELCVRIILRCGLWLAVFEAY